MTRTASIGVLLCVLSTSAIAATERKALLVSNSTGRVDQPTLRFVGADANRVGTVLTELGGFDGQQPSLHDASRAEVLAALASLSHQQPLELFVFYYSGHGDAGGLWLGESYLPTEEMMAAIRRVPAELRLVVLDACQSGGAVVRKGVALAPPVDVRIDQLASEGEVLIASSSAEEASFESHTLQGAVFTIQFVSGLRGAADEDDDGRITLSEAYRYASVRTLQATLFSSTGPQRPAFKWEIRGRSEPVLTHSKGAARLTLRSATGGSYFVFDSLERQLFAELELNAGQSVRMLLKAGGYVVRGRGDRDVRTARIELSASDDRVLDDTKMERAPLVHLARKGAFGQLSATLSGGAAAVSLGQMPMVVMQVGVELQRSWLLWSLEVSFLNGAVEREGLTVTQTGGGLTAALLPGLTVSRVTFRAGPTLGVLVLQQRVTSQPAAACSRPAFDCEPTSS